MQQIQIPPLSEGEIYLCGLINATGDVTHTILLPAEAETRMTWPDAMEWAKSLNADLPTRSRICRLGLVSALLPRQPVHHPAEPRVARPCRPQIDDLTLHPFSGEVSNDANA